MVSPYAAGGGADTAARLYAKLLGKYLPGGPIIIVRNMPGGATTLGSNFAYQAKPDGLTALVTASSVSLNQLVGLEAVRYDLLKMPIVVGSAQGATFYLKSGIISKPEDALSAKGLIYGSNAGPGYYFLAAKELLSLPVEKVVLAYSGEADARRAFFAGEINFGHGFGEDVVGPYIQRGEVMPFFQTGIFDETGLVRDPSERRQVPTVKELHEKLYGKSPSGIAWDAYKAAVAAARSFTYLLAFPPGTSNEVMKLYWAGAEKMVKDLEFRKVADAVYGEVAWKTGESFQESFRQNYRIDPKALEWLRTTLAKYGMVT